MAKRQARPLTPAEAVRQGQKLIAERRRQEAERKAAMQPEAVAQPEPISEPICQPDPPPAAWEGGAEADAGKPVPEQDQRVEVVTGEVAQKRKLTRNACLGAAPSVAPRVIPAPVEPTSTPPADLRNRPRDMRAAMSVFPTSSEVTKIDMPPDGAWPIADLRTGQCRFACTDDRAPADQHRFCGRPTRISRSNLHGSWCDEHLPRVWGQGSVSERNAHHVAKHVRRFG